MSVILHTNDAFTMSLASNIKDCQSNHIKFSNISFRCETIEDSDGTIFVRQKKDTQEDK